MVILQITTLDEFHECVVQAMFHFPALAALSIILASIVCIIIVASMSMNNLYVETATELVSVYTLLREGIAKGGTENMLTGAERSKTLWALNDKLSAFQKKLNALYLSIRYYTMTDVWNRATAGMIDRDNSEVANIALDRWRRAAALTR